MTLQRVTWTARRLLAAGGVVLIATAAAVGVRGLASGERQFAGAGRIVDVPGDGTVTIAHGDIAGLMPAMTMRFALASAEEGRSLAAGDLVRFRLRLDDSRSRVDRVVVTGHEDVAAGTGRGGAASASAGGGTRAVRVRPGDLVPAFALVDQERRPVTPRDFEGHLTLVTFIYTRCPLPEFCPLVTQRLRDVQDEIAGDAALAPRVRLLSVTLDPEFDTPDVLAAYGRAHGANPARWRYATGSPSDVSALARAFAVYTERNGATLDHTLATALVGGDGRVIDIWRGNGWPSAEVIAALRHARGAQ